MTVKTLDELREENAKLEQENSEQPASDELEVEEDAIEDEPQEADEVAEPESEESEESEIESWRLTDEQQSEEDEKTFTSHDIKKAKEKLKTRLSAKDDENESLKAEIEKLKQQLNNPQQAVTQQVKPKPTMESVDYDEDKFADEMADWVASQVDSKIDAKEKSRQLQQQEIARKQQIDDAVNSHLERAVKLDGIKPENYQAAELNVRRTIDSIMPKRGDAVADHLIATIGDGSEKIFYQLGVNSKLREEFQAKLISDNTGSSALVYLGELKGKLNSTVKRRSSAPKPAKTAEGGSSSTNTASALERKYKNAKTAQERFSIASEAKKAGLNPNTW